VPDFSRLPEFAAETIGWPFRLGGRGGRGVDCWGLVLHLMARCGLDLPDFGSPKDWGTRAEAIIAKWQAYSIEVPVSEVRCGDALFFLACGATGPNHIAVAIDRKRMVQATQALGVHIAPIQQHPLSPLKLWAAVRARADLENVA